MNLRTPLAALITLVTVLAPATAASAAPAGGQPWVAAWETAVERPFDWDVAPSWSVDGFADHSVRQVIRVSTGGSEVRTRLSNIYGGTPLRIAGGTIAKAGDGGAVQPGTLRPLTFHHSRSAVVPAGQEAFSDAIPLPTSPLERLAVTLYFAEPTGPATFHQLAFASTYRAVGDHRFDRGAEAFTETSQSWYYLTGVDVAGVDVAGGPARHRGAVVAFGDSITDGVLSTVDADNRYPDQLAERLVAADRQMGVLNAGIAGNRVLEDVPCFGDRAAARFGRDVLDRPGVRTVIILDSINDIGNTRCDFSGPPVPAATAEQLIEGFRALIRAAHHQGVKVTGATVTPFEGSFIYSDQGEAIRDAVNQWIRTGGEYDAVVDFDHVLADPADPDRIRPNYDSGDALHPNDAGFQAMANAIDLSSL